MLSLSNLSIRVGGRLLIESASVQLPQRGRIGLIGRNGTGKSTLLKAILGEISIESGNIKQPRNLRIGTVAQEVPSGDYSPLEHTLAANSERKELMRELNTTVDGERISSIHDRLNDIDAHSAPARASRILAGLGFNNADQTRPLKSFSGGWRMRVALAAVLLNEPDFLLLDEPTNHLDLEASIWLESFLNRYPNGILMVSHDRDLINKIVNGVLHLDNQKLTFYSGNFEQFEKTRREHLSQQRAIQERQQMERKLIQSFVDRFRYKASKAKQAQSRIKMLARMEPIAEVTTDKTTYFEFPNPSKLSPPILVLEEVSIGYNSVSILKNLNLRIDMDDRIALLGANGNGKTTLLRLLAGELIETDGVVRRNTKLEVGYFAQDDLEQLDPNLTAFDHLSKKNSSKNDGQVKAHLARFGLEQEKSNTQIRDLSGGEKARLILATITTASPHLLLLDEPTNHLDIDAREALIQALNEFKGAVIIVSHDPHLISLVADSLWLVQNGNCKNFQGDIIDYRKEILSTGHEIIRQERSKAKSSATSKREERKRRAYLRQTRSSLRKVAKEAELHLEKISAERDAVTAKLADPEIYEGPTSKVSELAIRKAKLDESLKEAELVWLEVHEALEVKL